MTQAQGGVEEGQGAWATPLPRHRRRKKGAKANDSPLQPTQSFISTEGWRAEAEGHSPDPPLVSSRSQRTAAVAEGSPAAVALSHHTPRTSARSAATAEGKQEAAASSNTSETVTTPPSSAAAAPATELSPGTQDDAFTLNTLDTSHQPVPKWDLPIPTGEAAGATPREVGTSQATRDVESEQSLRSRQEVSRSASGPVWSAHSTPRSMATDAGWLDHSPRLPTHEEEEAVPAGSTHAKEPGRLDPRSLAGASTSQFGAPPTGPSDAAASSIIAQGSVNAPTSPNKSKPGFREPPSFEPGPSLTSGDAEADLLLAQSLEFFASRKIPMIRPFSVIASLNRGEALRQAQQEREKAERLAKLAAQREREAAEAKQRKAEEAAQRAAEEERRRQLEEEEAKRKAAADEAKRKEREKQDEDKRRKRELMQMREEDKLSRRLDALEKKRLEQERIAKLAEEERLREEAALEEERRLKELQAMQEEEEEQRRLMREAEVEAEKEAQRAIERERCEAMELEEASGEELRRWWAEESAMMEDEEATLKEIEEAEAAGRPHILSRRTSLLYGSEEESSDDDLSVASYDSFEARQQRKVAKEERMKEQMKMLREAAKEGVVQMLSQDFNFMKRLHFRPLDMVNARKSRATSVLASKSTSPKQAASPGRQSPTDMSFGRSHLQLASLGSMKISGSDKELTFGPGTGMAVAPRPKRPKAKDKSAKELVSPAAVAPAAADQGDTAAADQGDTVIPQEVAAQAAEEGSVPSSTTTAAAAGKPAAHGRRDSRRVSIDADGYARLSSAGEKGLEFFNSITLVDNDTSGSDTDSEYGYTSSEPESEAEVDVVSTHGEVDVPRLPLTVISTRMRTRKGRNVKPCCRRMGPPMPTGHQWCWNTA